MEKGIALREAHGIVGSLVAECEKVNKKLSELELDQLKQCSKLIEEDVYERLDPANVVRNYLSEGAAGPKQAKKQLAYWQKQLAQR